MEWRDTNELSPNPMQKSLLAIISHSKLRDEFHIFYNLHCRLICIGANASDRRVLKWFQFIWIWHWTMNDSLLVIKIPPYFRSATRCRAREDAPREEQGPRTFSQASTIRHRWSDDGNWGKLILYQPRLYLSTQCKCTHIYWKWTLITILRWWDIGIEDQLSNSQCPNTESVHYKEEEVIIWSPGDNGTHGQGDNNWGSVNQDQINPAIFMTVMTPTKSEVSLMLTEIRLPLKVWISSPISVWH